MLLNRLKAEKKTMSKYNTNTAPDPEKKFTSIYMVFGLYKTIFPLRCRHKLYTKYPSIINIITIISPGKFIFVKKY